MGTGATGFRRLVSAFHDFSKKLSPEIRETDNYLKFFAIFWTFIHTLLSGELKKDFSISVCCG
jgi:hypothetical protein